MKTRHLGLLLFASSLASPVSADIIFDTGTPGGFFGYIGYDVSVSQSVAVGFTPTQDYTLDQISLWMMSNDFDNPGRTYDVSLRLDAAGGTTVPGTTVLESWSVATAAIGWDPVLEPVNSVLQPTLMAGVTYWIVAESSEPAGLSPVWVWGDSTDSVPFANIDFFSGPEWQGGVGVGSSPGTLVHATPVPGPASFAALGLAGIASSRRRR